MRYLRFLFLLGIISVVSGCATTSDGGMVLGTKGSPAWHKFAPAADIRSYWYGASMVRLSSEWDKAYRHPRIREAIGNELRRQGKDPMMFYNPQADSSRRLADEVSAAKSAARQAQREAREAKREAEQIKRDRSFDCIMEGRVC